MTVRTCAAAALAVLAAAAAGGARADCVLGKRLSLPVTMVGPRPTVEVKLEGKPVRLEADSGAFFSTLSPAATAALGLKTYPAPFGFHLIGINGEADAVLTRVKTFSVGAAEIPDVEFLVGGSSLQGEMGVVGLLGRNLLALWDTEYDFAHGELNIFTPKDCGSRPLAYWSKTPQQVEMAPLDGRDTSATAYVKVNGATLRAVFDTGASVSMLTLAGARRAGLNVHGPDAKPAGYTVGIGRRTLPTWLVPVTEVKIGDETVKNTRVRVSDYTLGGADMLVGADFFLSHRVYVAKSQRRIYFTYNGGPVFDLSVKADAPPPPEPVGATVAQAVAPPGPEPTDAAVAAAAKPPPPSGDEPKDADGYSRRGQAFAARRDYARALADLSRAVELDGGNTRFLRERAELRLATRQPFLAMTDLDAALKLAPDDAEAHLVRARLRASGRDRAGEEADLEAADKAAPKQADLRLALGSMYTGLERYDLATPQFDLWLASHAGDAREPAALNGRCWARALAGRDLEAAQRDCDAALRLRPRTAAYLDSRGLVELRRGELDRARADYDAALAIQPKLAFSLYGRGVVKARKGDAAGAEADLAAAKAIDPQTPERARRIGVTP